jgi:hypothetical protein
MALTDYKFWYITRDDDGFIIKAAIRFFEGEESALDEPDHEGKLVSVSRYRRIKRLQKIDLTHLEDKFIKESNGNDAKLYNPTEFGSIKTNDELRLFLNNEIAKDQTRTVVSAQAELLDIGKVK